MQPPSAGRKSAATAKDTATANTERVDSMSYTTRNCDICGKLMIHVDSRRHICRECSKEQRDEEKASAKSTAHTVGETSAKQEPPPLKRRVKPIAQCVREAEALGISYGRYVQRGYDKITWKKILKLEVL
nr:MAG TPA: PhnA Zinc-Ribbon [Caudoviricetes sp.]